MRTPFELDFEKEFPKLFGEEILKLKINAGHQLLFDEAQILAHCLDKERVKKALNELENNLGKQFDNTSSYSPYLLINKLKKELGL